MGAYNECNNIQSCEWWWCKTNGKCLLFEQAIKKLPTIDIAFSYKKKPVSKKSRINQTTKDSYNKRRKKRIFDRDGNKCKFCGSTKNLTIDHILPKSKGGSSRQSNLQTLCRDCNHKKADRIL